MTLKPKMEAQMVRRTSGIHLRWGIHRKLISTPGRQEAKSAPLYNLRQMILRLFCFAQSGESIGEWTRRFQ